MSTSCDLRTWRKSGNSGVHVSDPGFSIGKIAPSPTPSDSLRELGIVASPIERLSPRLAPGSPMFLSSPRQLSRGASLLAGGRRIRWSTEPLSDYGYVDFYTRGTYTLGFRAPCDQETGIGPMRYKRRSASGRLTAPDCNG